MRARQAIMAVLLALALLGGLVGMGAAQVAPGAAASASRNLGVGLVFTAPTSPPNTFPASGLSARIWLSDLLGIEVDFFVVDRAPSFTLRAFVKYLRTPLVDLYAGAGVSFFGFNGGLVVPFQAATGIQIRLTPSLALNAELGAYFRGVAGVTAGLGAYFYF